MNREALDTLLQHLLAALSPAPAETRRLFHGRGRCWPDLEQLTADWLQGVLLVTLFKEPQPEELQALRRTLEQLTTAPAWAASQGRHLVLQHRYRPDSACEWLSGEPLETWDIVENGLRFRLDLGRNQNTGLFLDMRLGRRWVQEQAAGRRVLNLFAYTCGFSVAAIAGGASQVVNLTWPAARPTAAATITA